MSVLSDKPVTLFKCVVELYNDFNVQAEAIRIRLYQMALVFLPTHKPSSAESDFGASVFGRSVPEADSFITTYLLPQRTCSPRIHRDSGGLRAIERQAKLSSQNLWPFKEW